MRATTQASGMPSWVAQLSPDPDRSRDFYAAVLGWTFENIAGDGNPAFHVASLRGGRVASCAGPQDPAVWITAVAVDDLEAARRRAVETGGTAPGESVDIATLGRFHRLHDPDGAEIHVVEPLASRVVELVAEAGAWSRMSLVTPDLERAAPFYSGVFGWTADDAGADSGAASRAGVEVVLREGAAQRSMWIPTFAVVDLAHARDAALARGARVLDHSDDEGENASVLLADSCGATFEIRVAASS